MVSLWMLEVKVTEVGSVFPVLVLGICCRAWRQAPLSTQLSFCREIFEAAK